eukprot:g31598.t1
MSNNAFTKISRVNFNGMEEIQKEMKTVLISCFEGAISYKTRKHQDWCNKNVTIIQDLIDKRKVLHAWQDIIIWQTLKLPLDTLRMGKLPLKHEEWKIL